jgi:hypothetical protein
MSISDKGKEIKRVLCKGERLGIWRVSPYRNNPASADYIRTNDLCVLVIQYDANYDEVHREIPYIDLKTIDIDNDFFIDYLNNFIKVTKHYSHGRVEVKLSFNSILRMFYNNNKIQCSICKTWLNTSEEHEYNSLKCHECGHVIHYRIDK